MKYPNLVDVYPSTAMQQGLLLHSAMADGAGMYMCQMQMVLEQLDFSRFRSAWEHVVARHDIFRTGFAENESGSLLQVVMKEVALPWQEFDWCALGADEQKSELTGLLNHERVTSFELGQAPLMRFALIAESDSRSRFVWTNHHALLDGWCLPIVFDEVMKVYMAMGAGESVSLPAVRPYRHYVEWLQKQSEADAKTYWQSYLLGVTAPTSPRFFNRSSEATQETPASGEKALTHLLDVATTEKLTQFAKQSQVTLNTVIQGAWALLLSQYSGEDTVVFGSTRSGRNIPLQGIDHMIGLFINTLPVRVDVSGEERTLSRWLQNLHTSQQDHDTYAYSALTDIQAWSDVPQGDALFNTLVVVENYPVDQSVAQEGHVHMPRLIESSGEEQTNFPVTLMVVPDESTEIKWLYQSELVNAEVMARVADDFKRLLLMMLEDPQQDLESVSLLTKEEAEQSLIQWNQTQTEYNRDLNLAQLFEANAAGSPSKTALVHGNERVSYQVLNTKANRLAHQLLAEGVSSGEFVGICLESGIDMITALLAIVKVGAVYVPIDSNYPEARIKHILEDTQLPLVLTNKALAEQLPSGNYRSLHLDGEDLQNAMSRQSDENLHHKTGDLSQSLAYVMYTSGSTGTPKGVKVTQRGIARLVVNNRLLPLSSNTVMLQCASVTFDAATLEIWGPLLNGGQLVLYPDSLVDAQQLGDVIDRHSVNTMWLTSGLFDQFVAINDRCLPSLSYVLTGGDVVNPQSVHSFYQQQPQVTVINGYGPTENTTFTTCFTVPRDWEADQALPIGQPISNTTVYVLDSNKKPLPIGSIGELYTGGEGLAQGYLHQAELTDQRFVSNPWACGTNDARLYRTGDLVRWQEDGNLLFVGRADDQVKIRGYRIELGEIERMLLSHGKVESTLVVAKDRVIGGISHKQLIAYAVTQEQTSELEKELGDSLATQLPNYMHPEHLVLLPEFPLTSNGKVDRRALPEPALQQESQFVAPETDTEVTLSQLWQELLQMTEPMNINVSFLHIGGNSLLLMRLNAMIKAKFDVNLPIEQLFRQPTIKGLSALIDDEKASEEDGMLDEILKQVESLDMDNLDLSDLDLDADELSDLEALLDDDDQD